MARLCANKDEPNLVTPQEYDMDELLEAIERMRKGAKVIGPIEPSLLRVWMVPHRYMVEVLALAETLAKAMDDEAGR